MGGVRAEPPLGPPEGRNPRRDPRERARNSIENWGGVSGAGGIRYWGCQGYLGRGLGVFLGTPPGSVPALPARPCAASGFESPAPSPAPPRKSQSELSTPRRPRPPKADDASWRIRSAAAPPGGFEGNCGTPPQNGGPGPPPNSPEPP